MSKRPPLTRARILQAALALADEEGLPALSMRRVAARLGVEAMSLYHHVPNKDAILDGVLDLLIETAKIPTGEVSIEEWIRGAADAVRNLAREHPRAYPLITARPVPLIDTVAAEPFEAGLAAFARAGYRPARAYAAVQAVMLSLVALALGDRDDRPARADGLSSRITDLPPERFPHLHAIEALTPDPEDIWATLLDALVTGLTSGQASRSRARD
jgi:AcrR family transcriptional regulator